MERRSGCGKKYKRKNYAEDTEFTEIAERRTPRAHSGVTVPQEEEPKTQAQTPCLGQPAGGDEEEKLKVKELRSGRVQE